MNRKLMSLLATLALVVGMFATAVPVSAATGQWGGNGYPSASCQANTTGTMLWIWTGGTPTSLTINGVTYTGWDRQGQGSYHLTLAIDPGVNYPPVQGSTTFVTYTGSAGTLTLSGCNEGVTHPLTATKTAAGTYDSSIAWTLDKSVDPTTHSGFAGDSFTSDWTVDVTKTVTEGNYAVTGSIVISNSNGFGVPFLVSDVLNDGTNASVTCPATTVPANGSVTCTYTAAPSGRSATLNTATISDGFGGAIATAAVGWTENVIGDTTTDLTDEQGPLDETLTSSDSFTYPGTFPCPTDVTLYVNGVYQYTTVNHAFLDGNTTHLTDSASVVTTCILRASATVVKVTNPAGGEAGWSMTLNGPGAPVGGETVVTTGTGALPFTTVLQDNGTYTITEAPRLGWIMGAGSADCSFTVHYPADAGRTFACSFTNTQRAHASLFKTVNGSAIPAGLSILFQLRSGASTDAVTGQGTILNSVTATSSTVFPLDLRGDFLDPGTYQVCEFILPGWNSTIRTLPGAFVPASNQLPANVDNAYVCAPITLAAGQNYTLTINNTTPPGGMAKTIGFWKNHASCKASNGKQDAILDQTMAAKVLATGSAFRVGDEIVDTCAEAVNLLNKSDLSGAKQASLPEFNFASQYMAYLLNVAAGTTPTTASAAAAASGQAILDAHGFIGNALPKSGAGSLSATEKANLNTYAGILDAYNNNTP